MRRVLMIVLSALVLSFLPGVPAHAVVDGGTFNVPRPWGSSEQKYRNLNKVVNAIDGANPGSKILLTSFLFDRAFVVDALVEACRRGVAVRLILDDDVINTQQHRIVEALTNDQVVDRNGDGDTDDPGDQPRTGPCNEGDPVPWPPLPEATPTPGAGAGDSDITEQQAENVLAADTTLDRTEWGPDRSYATSCRGSCRGGSSGNMHTKVYAFSSTGTDSHVVMVSSANLNLGGAALGWNDMYTMVGVQETFDFYEKIHREMTDERNYDTSSMADNTVVEGDFVNRFFPLDGAGKAKDPTLQDLNRIRCGSGFDHRTRIFISMFYWKGSRGDYLADKILNLARSGCQVSIIYGAPSVAIATRLRGAAKSHLISLWDSRWDFNNDGYNEIRTHSKYVLVKGTYGTDSRAHVVMTGSQNWVAGSLSRGDESSLNIKRESAYNDYLANWTQIRNHARRLPYNR